MRKRIGEIAPYLACYLVAGLLLYVGARCLIVPIFDSVADAQQAIATKAPPDKPAIPELGLYARAQVVRVIDGDTVEIELRPRVHVRLLDCWAPESRTTDLDEKARGLKSKAAMEDLCKDNPKVVVMLSGDMTLGRILGRVWLSDGRQLSEEMVRRRLATKNRPP